MSLKPAECRSLFKAFKRGGLDDFHVSGFWRHDVEMITTREKKTLPI